MQKSEELSTVRKCVEDIQKECISHHNTKNEVEKDALSFYNQIAKKSMRLFMLVEEKYRNLPMVFDNSTIMQKDADLTNKESISNLSYTQIDMQEQGFDILFDDNTNPKKKEETDELQEIKKFLQNLLETIIKDVTYKQKKEEIESASKTYAHKSKTVNIICDLFSHI